jgi:iron complex outermembrane receptor protein
VRASLLLSTGCALAAFVPTLAWAQSTSADAAVTAAEEQAGDTQGSEIIVTAQRRDERQVDVPIALTALSTETLKSAGITTTAELGQVVPGLRLDLSGAFFQPTVRGVGSATAGVGLTSNVATYIDGVYRPSPFTTNFELGDLESIQVLKGPQGTLFGRNATGGAILVKTADPSFVPRAHGKISYGRFNEAHASAAASTGLSDTIAVSLSGIYARSDGFVKDVNSGRDLGDFERYGVIGKLLFQPTDNLSFLLSGEHYRAHDDNVIAYNAFEGRTFARAVPGIVVPTKRGQGATDENTRYKVERNALSLRTVLEGGGVTATSITAYSTDNVSHQLIDFDATALPGLSVDIPFNEKTFTQELTFVSDQHGDVDWTFGLFYFYDKGVIPRYDARVGGTPLNFFNVGVTTNAYAAFMDVTWRLTERLSLTGGARYSLEDQVGYFEAFPPSAKVSAKEQFTGFTPRAVLRYEIDPDANVYLSYNRGFKAGGFAPTTFDLTPFRNEKIDAYEVGFKMARDRFDLQTSAFYYDYQDLQIANYSSGVGIVENAAQSEIYGADAQVTARVTDRFRMQAGVAYTHSEYLSFPDATFYPGTGTPTDPVRTQQTDASGKPLLRTPKWTGSLSGSYEQPIGDNSLQFSANYYVTSAFSFDPVSQFRQDGYGLLSGRIEFSTPGDRLSVALFGNNLTDETYLTQVLPFSGAILQTYGTPRTYGVEVGFKF